MKLYTIKKGKRRTGLFSILENINLFFNKNSISYRVKFTESTIYKLNDIENYGINKLFGLTFGLFGVHRNSARFGWRPFSKDKIAIYAYCYVDGVRQQKEIIRVKTNEYLEMYIERKDNKYIFRIRSLENMYTSTYEVQHGSISNVGYVNFLYFGGKKICPQDMAIGMEKIKSLIK